MNRTSPLSALTLFVLVVLLGVQSLGCASYSDRIRQAQHSVVGGDAEEAIRVLNKELGVEELDELPAELDEEKALLLLERATLLQAMGHYRSASRDMIFVDDRMEWIDIQSETADAILRFVYSDDAGSYRAPPHERLMLNTLNMINFLALSELSSARVEARRFNVLQTYFLDDGSRQLIPALLGLGNYLAGATFEASRDYREAARYYTLAYLYGVWPEADDHRLLDLIRVTGYTGGGLGDMRQDAQPIIDRARQRPPINRDAYRQTYGEADTLIVIQTGMVPYRKARRLPLNQALQYATRSPYSSIHLSPSNQQQALALYTAGTLTWLNVAELTREGLPSTSTVAIKTGDRIVRLTNPVDLGAQIEEAWHLIAGTALAAGISRAVVRAVAGEATRQATQAAVQQTNAGPYAGLIGWLTGAAVQASLSAADTPDTRSWTTLASNVHLLRLTLEPGPQTVDVQVGSSTESREVDVDAEGFNFLNFSRFR
jgi:uncharacterized protein